MYVIVILDFVGGMYWFYDDVIFLYRMYTLFRAEGVE